jgi:hypothetical protein
LGRPSSRVREVSGAILKKLRRMTNERPDEVRGPRRKPATKRMLICGNCGAEFLSSRSGAKWCSRSCQAYARVTGQSASRPRRPLQTLMIRRLVGAAVRFARLAQIMKTFVLIVTFAATTDLVGGARTDRIASFDDYQACASAGRALGVALTG